MRIARALRVRAYVRLPRYPLPDVTNHHRFLMTDVTGRIRRAGGMNYSFRATAAVCVRVGSSFTYRRNRNARKVISRLSRSVSRETAKLRTGNIGRGIMIFAERDMNPKMYADISNGYSYRTLGTTDRDKTSFSGKYIWQIYSWESIRDRIAISRNFNCN